ncbi:hypothetical protein [Alteromonas flava]|uniref:ApeP family dehydratase n=1 Tax=Alteromonas flava TaxID=2048003 RepID=UPI000C285398|nr:hypothetical protein [Alteromonas flava]
MRENAPMDERFDPEILTLIPHRQPMLLINHMTHLDKSHSEALVVIDEETPFFEPGKGVPTWIGIEYMGQTAALIAGYRLKHGLLPPHLGFLLGTRSFSATCEYFAPGTVLKVIAKENAVVADGFAKFDCVIENNAAQQEAAEPLAKASLSVFRKTIPEGADNEK